MKKEAVIEAICTSKAITIIRTQHADKVMPLVNTLVSAELPVMEITTNTPNHLELINDVRKSYPEVVIGAGTVTTAMQAGEAISAGAMYLVTPITTRDVLDYAKDLNIPVVMGAFSPTEIHHAYIWGADFIKLFPADYLGTKYLKSVRSTLPDVRFVPTGGVKLDNLAEWLDAGASAFGLGSAIINPSFLEEGNFEGILKQATAFRLGLEKYK